MADQRNIKRSNKRIYRLPDGDRKIIEQALEMSARSAQLLQDSPPDTFLGRKSQDLVSWSGSDDNGEPSPAKP